MIPSIVNQEKVCKLRANPIDNIDNLTKKIDLLKTKVQSSKLKQ